MRTSIRAAPSNEYSGELNPQVPQVDLYGISGQCRRCKDNLQQRDQTHISLLLKGNYGAEAARSLGISKQLESKNRIRFEAAGAIKRKGKGRPIFYEPGPRYMLTRSGMARGVSPLQVNFSFSRSHVDRDSPFVVEVPVPERCLNTERPPPLKRSLQSRSSTRTLFK